MQLNNVKKWSRNVTRVTANDGNIKDQLAASNHPCLFFTTIPGTSRKNNKCIIRCTKRKNKNDFKGKRVSSSGHFAKLSAEIELLQFRLSHGPKLNQKVVLDQLQKMIVPVTAEMSKLYAATLSSTLSLSSKSEETENGSATDESNNVGSKGKRMKGMKTDTK